MSDLLSQDEIDALLHGVDDVEEDEDDVLLLFPFAFLFLFTRMGKKLSIEI